MASCHDSEPCGQVLAAYSAAYLLPNVAPSRLTACGGRVGTYASDQRIPDSHG
jgi:hypothetical protein